MNHCWILLFPKNSVERGKSNYDPQDQNSPLRQKRSKSFSDTARFLFFSLSTESREDTETKHLGYNRLVALFLTTLPIRQIITCWSMLSENPKWHSNCKSTHFRNSGSHKMCIFGQSLIQIWVITEDSWVCSAGMLMDYFLINLFASMYYVFMICIFAIYYTSLFRTFRIRWTRLTIMTVIQHTYTSSLDVYEGENTKCTTIFKSIPLIISPLPENILVMQVCIWLGKNLSSFNGMWKCRAISAPSPRI